LTAPGVMTRKKPINTFEENGMTQQTLENVITRKPVRLPAALSSVMEVSQGFESPNPDSLRVVVTGRGGCGKTSFLASNPRSIYFDLERQPWTVIDPACTRIRIRPASTTAADDLRKAVDGIVAAYRVDKDLQSSISTVTFDSFDSLVTMFLRDLCTKNKLDDAGDFGGGHGKGYFRVGDDIFGMFERLGTAGLGVHITAHQSLKDIGGNQIAALNVSKSFRDRLVHWRDLMFKMECTSTVATKTRSGATINMSSKDPKDRRYVLITDTSTTAEDYDSPKSNVPMESGLVIPAKGGWSTFRSAYQKAVELRRTESTAATTNE